MHGATVRVKFAKFIIFEDKSKVFQTQILKEFNSNPTWNFRKRLAL
jgi:hypothetical protein